MFVTQYLRKSLLAGRYQRPIYNTLVMQEHTLHIISERAFDTFYSTHGNTVNKVYCIGECVSIWNNSENVPRLIHARPRAYSIRYSVFNEQRSKLRVCFSVPLTMAIL